MCRTQLIIFYGSYSHTCIVKAIVVPIGPSYGEREVKIIFFTGIQVFICHDAAMAVAHMMFFLTGIDVNWLDMKIEGTNRGGSRSIPQKPSLTSSIFHVDRRETTPLRLVQRGRTTCSLCFDV